MSQLSLPALLFVLQGKIFQYRKDGSLVISSSKADRSVHLLLVKLLFLILRYILFESLFYTDIQFSNTKCKSRCLYYECAMSQAQNRHQESFHRVFFSSRSTPSKTSLQQRVKRTASFLNNSQITAVINVVICCRVIRDQFWGQKALLYSV